MRTVPKYLPPGFEPLPHLLNVRFIWALNNSRLQVHWVGGSYPGVKAAGPWSWPLTSI